MKQIVNLYRAGYDKPFCQAEGIDDITFCGMDSPLGAIEGLSYIALREDSVRLVFWTLPPMVTRNRDTLWIAQEKDRTIPGVPLYCREADPIYQTAGR